MFSLTSLLEQQCTLPCHIKMAITVPNITSHKQPQKFPISLETKLFLFQNKSHASYHSENQHQPAEPSWKTESEHHHQQIYFADSAGSHDDHWENRMTRWNSGLRHHQLLAPPTGQCDSQTPCARNRLRRWRKTEQCAVHLHQGCNGNKVGSRRPDKNHTEKQLHAQLHIRLAIFFGLPW